MINRAQRRYANQAPAPAVDPAATDPRPAVSVVRRPVAMSAAADSGSGAPRGDDHGINVGLAAPVVVPLARWVLLAWCGLLVAAAMTLVIVIVYSVLPAVVTR